MIEALDLHGDDPYFADTLRLPRSPSCCQATAAIIAESQGESGLAEPADHRLIYDLGAGAEPDAGTGDLVCPNALFRPGARSGGRFGVRAGHRIGDPGGGAAFGLSALFVYSPLAFAIVKYCGAAYLVYLGVAGFLSGGLAAIAGQAEPGFLPSLARAYWQGLLTDLLNPKLLLFFFSFLPQFVDPARGDPNLQMLVLGLLFQGTGVPTNLAVALGGGTLAALIARDPFWAAAQRRCSSAVLIGLGVRLALSDRR
jgi:threonine/homoserine/homoserine lactone efflux protein